MKMKMSLFSISISAFFAELALNQLDNLGYQLNKRGITEQVNRHNCIAIALVQQQKLKGELARAELHWGLLKKQIKQMGSNYKII